jgi:hypothetical protein
MQATAAGAQPSDVALEEAAGRALCTAAMNGFS